jgi:hypothetical protein
LVVARGVRTASKTGEVDERGASDVVGYGFEGELEGMAEKSALSLVCLRCLGDGIVPT